LTEAVRQAVLVTRPEPGATETAERLDALGFDPVLAPSIRIRALQANLPPPARVVAVLITSGQAISAIPETYCSAKIFAVGDATAARARHAGFSDIVSARGDAKDLVGVVCGAVAPNATLLLVTGQGLGHSLAASLRAAGFAVIRRSVYAPLPVRRLPAPALCALRSGRLRAAMFFSADTALRFASMIERAALHDAVVKTDAVAISRPAAVALKGLPWRRILVADRPDQDAMLALLR
jgi:uroporphyrinogen-III synthase